MSSPESFLPNQSGLAIHQLSCPATPAADFSVVLIHGWAADSRVWQPLAGKLHDRYRILAVDLPGFGESNHGNWDQEAVLNALIGALPQRCVLVGWSLGGMLATLLASRWPERIAGLVTIATNACYVARPDWPDAMPESTFDTFSAAFTDDVSLCLRRFAALQAHGDSEARAVTRWLREKQWLPDEQQAAQWQDSLGLLKALDIRAVLESLPQASLHLFGAGDSLVPAAAADDFPAGPMRRVRVLDGCGHIPQLSRPALTAALIDDFLSERGLVRSRTQFDKEAVARSFGQAAARYDSAAHLQRRIGARLLAHLPHFEKVKQVLDLGCGTGYFLASLKEMFVDAELLGCDLAHGMVTYARQYRNVNAHWLCADAEHLPLMDGSVDLVFSSLVFQWCENWPQLARELYRILAPGGHAVFTTLGPGTLEELRRSWAAVDSAVHVNRFVGEGEVRGALVQAGFDAATFETVDEVIHYPVLAPLLRELKTLGARNLNNGRPAGLTGRARIKALEEAYEDFREPDGLPATWEVYYVIVRKPDMEKPVCQ